MSHVNVERVMTPVGPAVIPVSLRWNAAGVLPPPPAPYGAIERGQIRALQARGNAIADAHARELDDRGDFELWMDYARQYRYASPFITGWIGTGLVAASMGVAALRTWLAKKTYRRARPYTIDPTVHRIVGEQHNPSYPSGHAAASKAAATTLGMLWPLRAAEFHRINASGTARLLVPDSGPSTSTRPGCGLPAHGSG